MARSLKITVASILVLLTLAMSLFLLNPIDSIKAHTNLLSMQGKYHPNDTQANGPYKVQGNTILDSSGQPYLFHGVGRSGLEFSCTGDPYFDAQHLSYIGSGTSGNGITYWNANTVRLPVSERLWLMGYISHNPPQSCTSAQYQQLVEQTITTLTNLKLNVIIDLQSVDAGGQDPGPGAVHVMPDNDSVKFWQQVAPIYASYSNVLFELFTEPHPLTWSCWLSGCHITNDGICKCYNYQGVGMQTLATTVRNAGATNLVLVGGMDWGFDLSQVPGYTIQDSNVVYDTHPYPYSEKLPDSWDAAFGNISQTYPVISAESGQYNCQSGYVSRLLPYFDQHNIGWLGWAWTVTSNRPCGYPQLISDYNGTPAKGAPAGMTSMGMYEYQHLQGYLPNPPPTPSPSPSPSPSPTLTPSPSPSPTITPSPSPTPGGSPVSKTWYFAEGKVGQGFTEYLTLENPDPVNDCMVTLQYLRAGGSPVIKDVTVPHAHRYTESVNADLNTVPTSSSSQTDSAIITTTNPSCKGVVAERPMYFTNFANNISSGSDVVGATQLGTSFYFADMPMTTGYYSFITILNPSSSNTAHITATYYANGAPAGTQTLPVPPGTRGTINPPRESQHMTALVTSDQPVVVERPTYFSNINAGNAGTTSGAASVVGAQHPNTDWLFAEGYTGPGFQENLVLANFNAGATSASVTLEYQNGHTQTLSIPIAGESQAIVNVNQYYTNPSGTCDTHPCSTSPNVSAEVTAPAGIVAEREMFFHYDHITQTRSLSVVGGTDVTGEPGPAAATSFNFAEGYTNIGYDEWLTLQNPTSNPESISVQLVNGYGDQYTQTYPVAAHSRFTVDITGLVSQYVYHSGEDYLGYEVSMTVQSGSGPFVAERPMYWNVSGTQGGSDVIGYTGS
jgi:endoglucanase